MLIYIFLITTNCKTEPVDWKNTLHGNWAFCEKKGNYVELHINNEYLEWCHTIEPLGVLYYYKLVNDSIYLMFPDENTIVSRGSLTLIDNNNVRIIYTSKTNITDTVLMTKITEPLELFYSKEKNISEDEYIEQYQERADKKDCKCTVISTKKIKYLNDSDFNR